MHGGKSIVFHATFHGGQDVVVKARTLDLETEAQGSVHYSDETGAEVFPLSLFTLSLFHKFMQVFPGVEEFTAMVASHLSLNMNLTIEGSILFKLWPSWVRKRDDFSEVQNKLLLESSMKNVWTLALDPEYVLSRLFKHYDVFPELYGSCGGLYMVEEVCNLSHIISSLPTTYDALKDEVNLIVCTSGASTSIGLFSPAIILSSMGRTCEDCSCNARSSRGARHHVHLPPSPLRRQGGTLWSL